MGSGGGGNDSGGGGVTIRGGRMRSSTPYSSVDRTTDRQVEEKATIAGKTFGVMNEDERRELAISQLEERLENPQLPSMGIGGGTSAVISSINLKNQIAALKAGAKANFTRSNTGKYVAVGVTTEGGGTLGREGEISGMTARDLTKNVAVQESESPALTSVAGGTEKPSEPDTSAATSYAARRRIMSQMQKGQKSRIFYSGVRPSGL